MENGTITAARIAFALLCLATLIVGLPVSCAVLEHKERQLVFRIEPGTAGWYRGLPKDVQEFDIQSPTFKGGQNLHAWWWPAERRDAPSILYLHGVRWNLTGQLFRIEQLHAMGFAVLAGRGLDVIAVEVEPPHIYLEAPALLPADLAGVDAAVQAIPGVRQATEVSMLPGARRQLYLDALLASLADPVLDLRVKCSTAESYVVKAGDYIQIIDVDGRQMTDFQCFDARKTIN